MNKQTAVEWLVEQVNADCLNSTFIRKELIDEAKAMEREQIMNAWAYGVLSQGDKTAEQYYNENYGN